MTIYKGNIKKTEIRITVGLVRATGWAMFCAGVIALALSLLYISSVLAFIGLGLVFWGTIITYIRAEDYVKQTLLEATALPSLGTIDQMIKELNYKGKAVYLPPKYFRNPETNKAYISKQKNAIVPAIEETQKGEDQLFIDKPKGILMTPPGADLVRLFERTLNTSFMKIDMQQLSLNLQTLFVESLEIAQNVEIRTENSKISVNIENSAYGNLFKETASLSGTDNSLGCPISSATACILARATGKPVIIKNRETSNGGRTIQVEYCILEEEQTNQ